MSDRRRGSAAKAALEQHEVAESLAAVSYVDVCKEFRSRRGKLTVALDCVNLQVRAEEFVSVVGPSGCGKTTLLRMTAALEVPTRGRVAISGTPVAESRGEVGIMFQAPVLLAWRTVLKNVVLPIDLVGRATSADLEHARELLGLVGLADFADHYPRELSGGMQQRVALARALLSKPNVLLLDEPFGALDALTREDLNLELMRVLNQHKQTAVLITHSIAEAVFLSDRVVVMSASPGRVIEVVDVPLPFPRLPEMRYEPVFQELVRHITEMLTGRGRPAAA